MVVFLLFLFLIFCMLSFDFSFKGFNVESIKAIVELIKNNAQEIEFNSFSLGLSFPAMLSDAEKKAIRQNFQFPLVKTLEALLEKKVDYKNAELEILVNLRQERIYLRTQSIYVKGRYLKFLRGLPQTKYYCFKCKGKGCNYCKHKGLLAEESIEELIAKYAIPFFSAEKMFFHGSGREDINVLMLGNGRPFIIELIMPLKRKVDLQLLAKTINEKENGKIKVLNLEFSSAKEIDKIKHSRHSKVYEAIVFCEQPFNLQDLSLLVGKTFNVLQETPLRVLKRRAQKTRKHLVKIISFEVISSNEFKLQLECSAGCYVKEFISGDNNKTKPSISALLKNNCSCSQLDVIKIND